MDKKICVIGGGRWGKNHIKTLAGMGYLAAIVESNDARLKDLLSEYPIAEGFTNIEDAIARRFDGYTVAVPAEHHFHVGSKLLEAGLDVMMEKPMTMTVEESERLVEMAKEHNARLMVGHVLLFHPAIRKIKELIDSGKVGKLHYIYSNRLNLGTVRTEESVFASFAPHDISVLDYLIGSHAVNIEAKGGCFLQEKICDFTMTQLEYPDNVHGHIFVSWLHPFKQQLLVIVGSEGMITFDDATDKQIRFYKKGFKFTDGVPTKIEEPDEVIDYVKKMPLEEELRYFVENPDGKVLINNGEAGLEVVRILEYVQKMIENGK